MCSARSARYRSSQDQSRPRLCPADHAFPRSAPLFREGTAKKLAYLAFRMKGSAVDRIQEAVNDALPRAERSLLAVSGGIDSMVLLDAARAVRPPAEIIVATFDHASGPHAKAAV